MKYKCFQKGSSGYQSLRKKVVVKQTILYLLVVVVGIMFFSPFIWLLSTSLKDAAQVLIKPRAFFPLPLHFENYWIIFQKFNILNFFKNTFIVVGFCIVGNLFVSTLTAYALARMRFCGRRVLFFMTISCMFIPVFVIIVPRFILFHKLGILNTLFPLIIPPAMGSPFCIFLLRQFFKTIPMELSNAARIDGCGEFRIFFHVILPLSKPALIVMVIFTTQWRWNEFIEPLIYLQSEKLFTITMGLYQILGMGAEEITIHFVMAAITVFILPMVLLFLVAQKYFVEGITLTGLKG